MPEDSKTFVVKPTRMMLLMSEEGTDNIRKIYFAFQDLHLSSIELADGKLLTAEHELKELDAVLKAEEAKGLASHLVLGEVPFLPHKEVSELFHTLWTKATHVDDYDKKQWMKLDGILRGRGYEI